MRTTVSVDIKKPIDEVFKYTCEEVATWSLIVTEDEVIEGDGGVGTTFRTVTEDRGRHMEFSGRVVVNNPPHEHGVTLVGGQFHMAVQYNFESIDGGTRVTQRSEVFPKGTTKIFFLLFGWAFKNASCQAGERELGNLKKLMEAQ